MNTKGMTRRAVQTLACSATDCRRALNQARRGLVARRPPTNPPTPTPAVARQGEVAAREDAPASRRPRVGIVLLATAAGAIAAFVFDPDRGTRRRALARDKVRHAVRICQRRVRGTGRAFQGVARGGVHALQRRTPWHRPSPPDLDMYVKQRVESELGHDADLPLSDLNIDAAGGVVHLRGTVSDAAMAKRIVRRVAAVQPVRAVVSLLHTPEGRPVGGTAGDRELLATAVPAERLAEETEERLLARWPQLTAADITACNGQVDRLTRTIAARAGQPEADVRAVLDELLLTAV